MRASLLISLAVALLAGFLVGQAFPVRGTEASRPGAETALAEPPLPAVATAAAYRPVPQEEGGVFEDEEKDIAVFRRASASVVNVTSMALRRDWWSTNIYEIPQGAGSGFLWDEKGHVVTNYHVIGDGDRYEITLSDQSTWEAEVVGIAPGKDLAVLKIDAPKEKLVPLTLGRSSNLMVGQRVLALGNPFGLDHSLTVGVLSAMGRELQAPSGRTIRDVLQTDAAINPGNSGGPLLDSRGRLIGVNSAILSPSGAYAGVGFAIPVDTVRRLVPQLVRHGRPIQPGIGFSPAPDSWARRNELEGVILREVLPDTPAEKAGLEGIRVVRDRYGRRVELGDQIVAVNGEKVESVDDLLYAFEQEGVGSEVSLTVLRDGERREVKVELIRMEEPARGRRR
jgi:S1-C subfamily serine protease